MILRRYILARGQSLVEILLAVAVFTLGVVTIGFLVLESFASTQFTQDSLTARLLAQEGLEAVRALRDTSFDAVEVGTHGIAYTAGAWALTPASDVTGKFTRSIVITNIDPEVREVLVTVTWDDSEVVLATQLSNWHQNAGEAGRIDLDLNNAALSASSTHLSGIALINNSGESSTLGEVSIQWSGGGGIAELQLGETTVFSVGSSSAPSSGDIVDISDYEVTNASGYHLLDVFFTAPIEASEAVVSFIGIDGSRKHARVSL